MAELHHPRACGINVQATTASGRSFQRIRNGLPEPQGYVYRAPRPDWAIRALAAAEAAHGTPSDGDDGQRSCGSCGESRPIADRTHGIPVCCNCYKRWRYQGFPPGGPGPSAKPHQADSAREHLDVITSMSAREAAAVLGCTPRTIQRWRTALAVAS